MVSQRKYSYGRTALALVATIPFLYPFVFLIGTVVKTREDYVQDPVGLPDSVSTGYVSRAWNEGDLGPAILHSMIAVLTGVVLLAIVSSMAAFWFMRHRGRLARLGQGVLLALTAFPVVVMVIPLFVLLANAGLSDNLVVLGVVYAAINAPFGVFLMRAYFENGIPPEVLEAAEVDGASVATQFLRIVLPLSLPALATLMALGFVWSWGDLLISVVLVQDETRRTLTTASAALVSGRFDYDPQLAAATVLISMVPVIFVFMASQRALVRGLTGGVGK